jgi:hypothetical protein
LSATGDVDDYVRRVIDLVNHERFQNGNLPPLRIQDNLMTGSQWYAEYMAVNNWFDHTEPSGRTAVERMNDFGYNAWSMENLGAGYSSPETVVNAWMNSSGHRANILRSDHCEIGAGYDASNNFLYYHSWVLVMGCRSEIHPVIIEREAAQANTQNVELYLHGGSWAEDMRFRNESGNWSSWEPFSETKQWNLSSGFGTKTVTAEMRNFGGTVRSAFDTIDYIDLGSGLQLFASRLGYLQSSRLNTGASSWSPWEVSNDLVIIDTPVQVVFNNKIVQVGRGIGNWIYTRSSDDGINWTNWSEPNGRTVDTPSQVEYNGELIQTVRGNQDWIYTRKSSDGENWSSWSAPNGKTIDTPVQIIHNNEILQIVRGTGNWIYTRTSSDGSNWSNWSQSIGYTEVTPAVLELSF